MFPISKQIRFTQVEFGSLQSIYQALKHARVRKDHAKLISSIHSYIRSLSSTGLRLDIPKKFKIAYIREEVFTEFPAEISYIIVIILEEEKNGKL